MTPDTSAGGPHVPGALAPALLTRRGRQRRRVYRGLAERRETLIARRAPHWAALPPPDELRAHFARECIVRVAGVLAPEGLAELRAEARANRPLAERSVIPRHKKGGALSYEAIDRHAPACLAFYHPPELHEWLGAVAGERLFPTADHDQSSCSILSYDQPGEHIHRHYDYNFYRGRHFTVLLSLVNCSPNGAVSSARLVPRIQAAEVIESDTAENVLVVFEGARVLHRASPIADGDERVMLSVALCTDPGIHPLKELARRVKDTASAGRVPWSIGSAVPHLRP